MRYILKHLDGPRNETAGVRKVFWQPEPLCLPRAPTITYADLGYTQAKHKSLVRMYQNEESRVRALETFNARDGHNQPTSVTFSTIGQPKANKRAMGHCLQAISIVRFPKGQHAVDVYYRSTEITRKFGGDLCFLPGLLEPFNLPPNTPWRYNFAMMYASSIFMPTVYQFVPPHQIFEYIEDQMMLDKIKAMTAECLWREDIAYAQLRHQQPLIDRLDSRTISYLEKQCRPFINPNWVLRR